MRLSSTLLLAAAAIPSIAATRPAQVYFLPPNPTAHHAPPALNPTEANTLISHHLGFDVYETIGDRTEGWWNDLSSLVLGGGKGHGVGEGNKDSVLLVIHSDHPEDFVPSTFRPSFSIPDPPESSAFTDLITAYTERAHQLFDSVFQPMINSISSSPAYKSLLDIFDLVGEAGQMFVEEFGRLVELIDEDIEGKKAVDKSEFASVEIKSLAEMPRNSEEYVTAVKSVQAVLGHPSLLNKRAAIIVVPSSPSSLGRRDLSSSLKSESTQQQGLSSSSNKIVFSTSTCHTSNDTCASSTNNCTGHGTCQPVTIAGKTCYTCACSITRNDAGRRQWWAGAGCEKLDLSTPFTLLAGTGVALVVLVIFSVYLLMGVGEETLPNTLTATTMPVGNKRD